MGDATVTLRSLSLGAYDSTTGWPAMSFATSSIEGAIVPKGFSLTPFGIGIHAQYDNTFITPTAVYVGDEIYDAHGNYWQIQAVQHMPWLNQTIGYQCSLVKRDYALPPTTSGTWHLDSDSVKTDQRYLWKYLLDNNLGSTRLLEDNGSTQASWKVMFDGVPVPFEKMLTGASVDLIFTVGKALSKPRFNWLKQIYAFDETVTVTAYALDKSGLTAANLIEQAEQEIRHVVTDNASTALCIRRIASEEPSYTSLGATKLWHTKVTIDYRRTNDDLAPSYPLFDIGTAFTYEGDRLSGGAEGTWTLTQGGGSTCAQSIDAYGQLDLNQTVFGADSYTINGTNLGLSTTLYSYIRFRYKTSGASTAKIVVTYNDASTDTALSETASSTWTVGTFALDTGKTLDHITLYNCDGVGHVYYDFVVVYTGTYLIPNVVEMHQSFEVNSANILMPGRSGSLNQLLGSNSLEVRMTCDIDLDSQSHSWKRPQTTTPATDTSNDDALSEVVHYHGSNEQYLWAWLDLGNPPKQFKAQLIRMEPSMFGGEGLIDLVWREYRHGSASNETYRERFGLDL